MVDRGPRALVYETIEEALRISDDHPFSMTSSANASLQESGRADHAQSDGDRVCTKGSRQAGMTAHCATPGLKERRERMAPSHMR